VKDLSALFAPRSVAVVGASNDSTKYGNWISVQALRGRHRRQVHLINRRGESVLGEVTYRRLTDLGRPVDLVVIAVPAAGFADAVDDALAVGARAIVGVTAGFAEVGDEGRTLEAELAARVRSRGAMLLGPNCLGILDNSRELHLTSNPMPPGPVGLISQSGNLALEISAVLETQGLGISRFASLGNQADLTAADLLEAYATDEATELIGVYCEDFRDGRGFVRTAGSVGKPVVLLAAGAGEASARAARSHTGAMTSGAVAVEAACRAAGIEHVTTPREMALLLSGLRHAHGRGGRRIAVMADGGGTSVIAADVAERHGLTLPRLPKALAVELRRQLPPSASTANPIDLAGAGERDLSSFARVLDLTSRCADLDAVLVTGYFGGYGAYGDAFATTEVAVAGRLAAIARERDAAVVVHTMFIDSAAAGVLRRGGVPVVGAVEDAAWVLGRLAARAERRPPDLFPLPVAARPVLADGYWESRSLLQAAGLRFPPAERVAGADAAAAAASRIGYPVTVKALGLAHKSDVGGVVLGLTDAAAVRAAIRDLRRRLGPPGYAVEKMVEGAGGVELIVGVRRDRRFGPVVMVGAGGIFTELLRDTASALAPVGAATAKELIGRLRAAPLLRGTRGRPPVDLEAVAAAIAAVSELAAAHPEISELEVNPLLVSPAGAVALDARVVLPGADRS
jgi:acyl-CoA synthetase (NDP forming)